MGVTPVATCLQISRFGFKLNQMKRRSSCDSVAVDWNECCAVKMIDVFHTRVNSGRNLSILPADQLFWDPDTFCVSAGSLVSLTKLVHAISWVLPLHVRASWARRCRFFLCVQPRLILSWAGHSVMCYKKSLEYSLLDWFYLACAETGASSTWFYLACAETGVSSTWFYLACAQRRG